MWALALTAVCIECAIWGVFLVAPVWRRDGAATALGYLLLAMFGLRALLALASYALSRIKGMAVPVTARLSPLAWGRFFLVEYGHLCAQSLLLIPFRHAFRTPAERGQGAAGGRVLLLQHGYINNGGVWFPTARALSALGYRVYTCDQPAFAPIDAMGARLAARVDEVLAATGAARVTLVAHSMGGLVCRAYLRAFGGDKVDGLITLGSPHHGTFHAYLANGENGRQMRPGNAWLAELNRGLPGVPFTSVYSVHDTVISPQDSSVVTGVSNVQLAGIGHVSMPGGAATRQVLIDVLQKMPPRG